MQQCSSRATGRARYLLQAEGTAQIFVSCAEFKAKSNYTRQTKLSLVISMKRGQGRGERVEEIGNRE